MAEENLGVTKEFEAIENLDGWKWRGREQSAVERFIY